CMLPVHGEAFEGLSHHALTAVAKHHPGQGARAMSTLEIQVLGEFCLVYADASLSQITAPRLQALLAYLMLHRAAPQPHHRLAFPLWPDTSEAQARTNLRQLVHVEWLPIAKPHTRPQVERVGTPIRTGIRELCSPADEGEPVIEGDQRGEDETDDAQGGGVDDVGGIELSRLPTQHGHAQHLLVLGRK